MANPISTVSTVVNINQGPKEAIETLTTIGTGTLPVIAGPDWVGLTRALAGCPFDHETDSAAVLERLISHGANGDVQQTFLQHLSPSFLPTSDIMSRIVQLMVSIAGILRKDADISISFIDDRLVEQHVFSGGDGGDPGRRARRQGLVFMAIGWMTNLFNPTIALPSASVPSAGALSVDTEQATCFETSTVSPDLIGRPLAELLRHFGDLLPRLNPFSESSQGDGVTQHESEYSSTVTLHVASINVSSLSRLGSVKVEWTQTISSHLDFDPARLDATSGNITPVLKIFRYPSLCYQHAPQSSILHK